MPILTKKQKQVFDFIDAFVAEKGFSPSMEEIRVNLNLKAVSTIHQHINALKAKGYLLKTAGKVRPKTNFSKILKINVIGNIAAGEPIEAIEEKQMTVSIAANANKTPKDYYALKVKGGSMIDEGIFDGDIVVIKKQSTAENGQTVVAIIDDNCATLKKLYREKKRFRLEPANQAMLPFYREEVEVRGVVSQIIRKMDHSKDLYSQKSSNAKLRTLDLFAGMGGLRIGFEKAKFETVFANDIEPQCGSTYNKNFKTAKLIIEDIRKIGINDLPEFDFLIGGFPCQAFSIAGYREGFKDKKNRGNLFFLIAEILEKKRPLGFLLENVKNLKSHDNGKTYKVIENILIKLGYHIKAKVLNTMEYGNIPQNRERIYIAGFLDKKICDKFSFPEKIPLTKTIYDCLEKNIDNKYYYNSKELYPKLKVCIKKRDTVYQWRRKYVRENKNKVCPTLTANMGMGGHNVPIILDEKGIRKLTPTECANFQGFPKDYILPGIADSHLYKQIGNSVSVPVVERIAYNIKKALE